MDLDEYSSIENMIGFGFKFFKNLYWIVNE